MEVSAEPMWISFILGFCIIILLFWNSLRKQRYWKDRGIPHVTPLPFFGSVLENSIKIFHDVELERYKKHGRIYGHFEANRPLLSVAEPDVLRDILVKDFQAFTGRRRMETGNRVMDNMISVLNGEDWKRVRTILTPTFTTGKIKKMMSIFKDCAQTLVNNFKDAVEKGQVVDVKRIYGAFTMDVIASSAFSTKIDSHNDPNNAFVRMAKQVFAMNINWRFLMYFLAPRLMKIFKISLFPPVALDFFTNAALQIMEHRKRTGQTRNDFLQLLMDAAKEASEGGKLNREEIESDGILENYGKDESQQIFKNAVANKSLSPEELVGQCLNFFFAGYETTSSTLSFASYFLALNPKCQERLIQEIDNTLKETEGEITYEAVQSMKYLDNVISETLRFYSPLIRLERVADEDYKLGDTGIIIPKGMLITIPIHAIHRDPEYFPNPEKFDPDRYSLRKQRYWKDRGIPYVAPFPFLGSVMENSIKILHDVELERYKKYGRIYGHYEANRPLLSVAEPDILRSIFVKDFQAFTGRRRMDTGNRVTDKMVSIMSGEDWKRVRTILTPTFTTGKIKRMMSIFKNSAQTLLKNFMNVAQKGDAVEIKKFYGAFTMDVIASTAFSTKIDSHNDPNNIFVKMAKLIFTRNITWRFVLFSLAPSIMKFFKISVFSPKAVSFFGDAALQIMEHRKKTGQTRNDFLQLLMDAVKEADGGSNFNQEENESDRILENYGRDETQDNFRNSVTNKSLSPEELVGQCVNFFFAGHETTAGTLTFASYFLALNPECQEKLIREVDDMLKETGGEITYEAVQNMKYLDNVISETLRFYPPLIRLERVADEDYKLADTGITIPKDMIITIPIYAMHRDPEYFPDPEKFDPDRFNIEERKGRSQFVYMPFGAGPRNCIGMRFGLIEVKVCLAYVLSHFRIKNCAETKVPLDFYSGLPFIQVKDITLKLQIRKDALKIIQDQ